MIQHNASNNYKGSKYVHKIIFYFVYLTHHSKKYLKKISVIRDVSAIFISEEQKVKFHFYSNLDDSG